MEPITIVGKDNSSHSDGRPNHKYGIELTLQGADLILNRHLGKSCNSIKLLKRGCNNKAYIVMDSDENVYVIRLTGIGRLWRKMKTEQEIAGILCLAAKCPNIPVPKILGFCSSRKLSGVDAEYILMEKLPGIPLEDVWLPMGLNDKLVIAEQLAKMFVQMMALRFDQIGSFLLPKIISDAHGIGVDITEMKTDDITIGPIMEQRVGPFKDYLEFLRDSCRREIEVLQASEFMQPQLRNLNRIENFIEAMTDRTTTKLKLEAYTDVRFGFHHGDFDEHNILVDGNKVTGIVDFEFCGSFPIDYGWIESLQCLGISMPTWRFFKEPIPTDSDEPELDPETLASIREFAFNFVEELYPDILPKKITGHTERTLLYHFLTNICPWYLSKVTTPTLDILDQRARALNRIDIILDKYRF